MLETAIKSNEREAARLYQRGVAAARGGQRRVAAGLLSRAVQLNPRHELAWLWLSGVLDAPDEIWLITYWRDEPSYRTWHRSHHYRDAHKGIPKGVKLVPKSATVRFFDHVCS